MNHCEQCLDYKLLGGGNVEQFCKNRLCECHGVMELVDKQIGGAIKRLGER